MKNNYLKSVLLSCIVILTMGGCKEKDNIHGIEVNSCETCHTDYAMLQKVYSPDTEPPASGCGGDAPYYEPYDRVYMGGDGFTEFKSSGHYEIGCAGCHNGDDKSSDKDKAHSGTFIAHPSAVAEESCGTCHKEISTNFASSLHNGMGQKRKVAIRSGYSGSGDFDKLPAHQTEGYNKNCATCHGTCGNCHVVRPLIGGGGLAKGHMFTKEPDMVGVCVTCLKDTCSQKNLIWLVYVLHVTLRGAVMPIWVLLPEQSLMFISPLKDSSVLIAMKEQNCMVTEQRLSRGMLTISFRNVMIVIQGLPRKILTIQFIMKALTVRSVIRKTITIVEAVIFMVKGPGFLPTWISKLLQIQFLILKPVMISLL